MTAGSVLASGLAVLFIMAAQATAQENHAFEVLNVANQTYQGVDFFAIEARLPEDGQSGSENWCKDYRLLCAKYGLKPTGCGEELMGSVPDVDRCVTEYDSDPNINNVLGCVPADGVAAVAGQAFTSATVTSGNSFGFYRCSTSYCQRGIVESQWSLTSTSEAFPDPGDRMVYTVCKGSAAVRCPMLSAPENGAKTGSNYYSNVVDFTCESGYELDGDASTTCQVDGTWTHPVPTCTALQCPEVTGPDNGAVTPTDTRSYGDVVRFTCDAGYELDGEESITCQADGTWDDDAPTCRDIDGCSPSPCAPLATCTDTPAPRIGATCTCEPGYDGDGAADGTGCTAVHCPEPTPPENGGMYGHSFSYMDEVKFYCNRGDYVENLPAYRLDGAATLTCQADGTWSDPVPTCIPKES
ncbi:sushi, von Willebrand factor type A, EGF and pentraxin domain-containing protein 1-like [Branchiostoma floridae]|uniref:Sushi, von Willebrand factor type A, EGF and pentraxin domain-containing protein 1-like n=1 Tax=Branchiostoma floridae TaxID=7739 RepID=A0A9J7KFT1_BRAFL|nr:sushi, von Willebrand factor type A, EGF and pentraxin domain-containing protein 1-like [Branchiostoma floridae]